MNLRIGGKRERREAARSMGEYRGRLIEPPAWSPTGFIARLMRRAVALEAQGPLRDGVLADPMNVRVG